MRHHDELMTKAKRKLGVDLSEYQMLGIGACASPPFPSTLCFGTLCHLWRCFPGQRVGAVMATNKRHWPLLLARS